MLSVGVIGAVFLGNIQGRQIDHELLASMPLSTPKSLPRKKVSIFGKYQPLDKEKVATLSEGEQKIVADTTATAKKNALMTVAIFPAIMLVCYLILLLYFRAKGGYEPVEMIAQRE